MDDIVGGANIQASVILELRVDGENASELIRIYREKHGTDLGPTVRNVRIVLRELRTRAAIDFMKKNGKNRIKAIKSLKDEFFVDSSDRLREVAKIVDDALARM